jgi:sugar/nucleoside kinase (ribokinase family)
VLKKRGNHISPNDQDGFLSSTIGSLKKGNSKINQLVDIKSIVTNKSKQIKLVLNNGQVEMMTVPACGKIIKTTGAGDTLTGTLASMLCRGKPIRTSLKYAIAASELSIQTSNT